jgi:hypothetical protein
LSSFGFSPLHFLFNKQGLGAHEVLFYSSRYLIFLFCYILSCFGFSLLHLLFNKQALGAEEVLFYWSRYLFFLICSFLSSFGFSPLHFLFNKQGLGAQEVVFTRQGTCFFNCVPSCPLLVSLPFISYLTNKDLRHSRFYFTGQGP